MNVHNKGLNMRVRFLQVIRFAVTAVTALGILLSTAGATLLLSPNAARAQAPEDRKRAKAAFRKARKAYMAKEYDQAAELFKEAYDFDPKPGLLYNIGQSLSEAGVHAEALDYLQRYLVEKPDARNAKRVEKTIAELKEFVDTAGANIMIQASTEGLDVFVDDEEAPRCVTPCMVSLTAGSHRIGVGGEGLERESREVTLVAGSTETYSFDPKPAVRLGSFRVQTTLESGRVFVDGSEVAAIPMGEAVELAVGDYQVSITDEGETVWTGPVHIEANTEAKVRAERPEAPGMSTMGVTAIALGGVGLASLGAGVYFGLAASDAEASLDAQLNDDKTPDSAMIDSGEQDALFANIFYGVGLVAVGTGVTLLFLDGGESEKPAEPRVPALSMGAFPLFGGAAVTLEGGF